MIRRIRIRCVAILICVTVLAVSLHRPATAGQPRPVTQTQLSDHPQQQDSQKPKEPEKRKKEDEKKKNEGELNQFEDEATKDATDDDAAPVTTDEPDLGWLAWSAELLGTVFLAGGVISWVRVHGTNDPDLKVIDVPRLTGEVMTPFATLDIVYQNVTSDITAIDGRIEVGYGPGGIQFRETHYEEDDPYDKLDFIQWHILYRMTYSQHIEVDIGLGSNIVRGDGSNSGFSVTVPIRVQPIRWVGAQFRPNWSSIKGNSISDYDVGITIGPRYLFVRGGYRWVKAGSATLNGPYTGLTFCF
ncbi:MAG: hypothetical protein JSW50_12865 [Candidatus Latescibacterota bacterium]|nr:MAG: hypothetical protein JSW50_12865 [Candidatus Latescibacterota bacterium]